MRNEKRVALLILAAVLASLVACRGTAAPTPAATGAEGEPTATPAAVASEEEPAATPTEPAAEPTAATDDRTSQAWHYYRSGDNKAAIDLARQIIQDDPDGHDIDPLYYLLAWAYSLEGDVDSSLACLEELISRGHNDYNSFMLDRDLENARSAPGFDALMELARQQALQENEQKAISLEEGYWNTFELESEYDLPKVTLSLQYDDQFFTIKAELEDAHFRDGERSWRYGDGFLVNFITAADDDAVYSDRFYSYGFSREHRRPIAVLVGRDGTYYLESQRIAPTIEVDEATNTANYLIQIPWTYLAPFQPLLDEQAGINILYTSQNDDGSRKQLQYVPDSDLDSERTSMRRFAPLHFVPSDKSVLQMVGALETRLVSGDEVNLSLAVWAPEETPARFAITVEELYGDPIASVQLDENLSAGKNLVSHEIALPETPGAYQVKVSLNDSLEWEDRFYQLDRDELARLRAGIQDAGHGATDLVSSNSADGLAYHLEILESQINSFSKFDDPDEIRQALRKLGSLYDAHLEYGSIYVRSGYLLSAFRSPSDGTLQPFSINLPTGFDPANTYDLVVALHGSGVDEVGFLRDSAATFPPEGVIVLGPRGRNLSDFYTGATEDDVVDLVQLAQEMFNVDKTLCYGFSMGGYGTWRMSFLHPELFDGAIVVSGIPYNPRDNTEENDMRNYIGNAQALSFLVIHGTDDPQLSIETTDEFVAQLEQAGYQITYERVAGGGHANFSVGSIVNEWLRER